MKKTNGSLLGLLTIIIFTEIALMDYFFPGLVPDSRLRSINILLILSALLFFLIASKFLPDQEETKKVSFFY